VSTSIEQSESKQDREALRSEPLAKFVSERAGINPAPTEMFVGEGFIPSLPFAVVREFTRGRVFARGSSDTLG
jgi:hypothetical protein